MLKTCHFIAFITIVSLTFFVASSNYCFCFFQGTSHIQELPSNLTEPLNDCGVFALHQLLRIEGYNCSFEKLKTFLPPSQSSGYSMMDLKSAAAANGLYLFGATLHKNHESIDRPMIVFVERGNHGHFIMIRPVGHSNTLVQVFDSTRHVQIYDKASLMKSREWTCVSILPYRKSNYKIFLEVIAIIITTFFILTLLLYFKKTRNMRYFVTNKSK